jgi:hypothetical protein
MLAPRKKLWSTPLEVIDIAIEKLQITSSDIVFDIGAGDGRFLIRCGEKSNAESIIGIEIDEERGLLAKESILSSIENGLFNENKCHLIIGNALEMDYSKGNSFFLYLVPRGLRIILPILQSVCNQSNKNITVVTYMSPFPSESGIKPLEIVKINTESHPEAQWPLYVYELMPNIIYEESNILTETVFNKVIIDNAFVSYTVHHNWQWIIEEVVQDSLLIINDIMKTNNKNNENINYEENNIIKSKLNRPRELPSQLNKERIKPQYSLFRIEIIINNEISKIWSTSLAFTGLDAKDNLYRLLNQHNSSHLMPLTTLLPYDLDELVVKDNYNINSIILPSTPCLLKAALGSGGFGIYFLYDIKDAIELIKKHRLRAELEKDFLDSLRRDYIDIPSWSLQELINSVRIRKDKKKVQIRSYVTIIGNKLFLYLNHEVRVPSWDIDLDKELYTDDKDGNSSYNNSNISNSNSTNHSSNISNSNSTNNTGLNTGISIDVFEDEICKDCDARPYNLQRNKTVTERILLDELDEIRHTKDDISKCIKEAMTALKPIIESKITNPNSNDMAIAGIDLMLADKSIDGIVNYKPYIVELNNNPAMPGKGKLMSERYKLHLKDLIRGLITIGITNGEKNHGFERIW